MGKRHGPPEKAKERGGWDQLGLTSRAARPPPLRVSAAGTAGALAPPVEVTGKEGPRRKGCSAI